VPEFSAALPSDARILAANAQILTAPEFQYAPMRKKPVVVLAIVLAGFLAG
jgi:hypothetical protein